MLNTIIALLIQMRAYINRRKNMTAVATKASAQLEAKTKELIDSIATVRPGNFIMIPVYMKRVNEMIEAAKTLHAECEARLLTEDDITQITTDLTPFLLLQMPEEAEKIITDKLTAIGFNYFIPTIAADSANEPALTSA